MEKEIQNIKIAEEAKPFVFEGRDKTRAIIYIHGFSGSLATLRDLAEKIARKKEITSYGICLSGHGTSPDDLSRYRFKDWRNQCRDEVKKIIDTGIKDIYLVGLSVGGLLALEVAAWYPDKIKKVVCLDTPTKLKLHTPIKIGLRFSGPLKYWKKKTYIRFSKKEVQRLKDRGIYDCMPIVNVKDLMNFLDYEITFLGKVKSDLLLIQGERSFIINNKSAQKIYDNVSSVNKKIVYIKNRFHTNKIEREIFEKTLKFLELK